MLEELNALAKKETLIVEFPNGNTAPVKEIYEIKGRGGSVNILVDDYSVENLEDELFPSEIIANISSLENEANNVESAIENFEYRLGVKTKCRQTFDRIDELAEIMEARIEELEEEITRLEFDNRALAWNVKELEKWKENTLKDSEK